LGGFGEEKKVIKSYYIMSIFPDLLKNEILKGLPGTEVQWQMASSDRMLRNFPRMPGKDALAAAVLILLFPDKGSIHTVLMQRHDYKGVHGGQISLPGGKRELSDENIIRTAIREANEETGVDPSKISVIGTLTPLFIPVSKMIVTPVVGWTEEKPAFNHQPEEVVFLIDIDLRILLDPSIVKTKPFEIRGDMIDIKYFDYEGNIVWGATAMILHELLTILRRRSDFF
jgi:8-oxo-dGTP pyrophosphatase MutT (NUDIX family)